MSGLQHSAGQDNEALTFNNDLVDTTEPTPGQGLWGGNQLPHEHLSQCCLPVCCSSCVEKPNVGIGQRAGAMKSP